MINKTNFQIINSRGLEIDIDTYTDGADGMKIPVVFCHGFKGFKNWGGFPYMLNKIAESGYFAIGFNFSCSGVSKQQPMDFTRLDLFEINTFSRELEDLNAVIEYFSRSADKFKIDGEQIYLMGHSRGGGSAILHTSQSSKIKKLVTLSSVSTFDRYGPETKRLWRKNGFIEMENTRTKQMMRMNTDILDDIEQNKSKLDILAAAKKISSPFLIVHGKEDLSVKCSEAEDIYSKSDKSISELFLIENTGHTFGVVHPFAGTTPQFDKVIERVIGFFTR